MDKSTDFLGEQVYESRKYQQMWKMLAKIDYLLWTPRVLAIGMIIFLGLFALDVFEEGKSVSQILIGLLMHLVPNYILGFLLLIAWKKEILGGSLFLLTGLGFWYFFNNPFFVNLLIFGPLFLIGILFILHGFRKISS